MSDVKPPMSMAYKAVFAFSIFMMLLALLGGSKSGIGILLWGYTAWLMFKRNNSMLVTTFKALLWFEVVVGGVGLIALAVYSDDSSSIALYGALILLAIAISYGMMQFFEAQIEQGNKDVAMVASNSVESTTSMQASNIAIQPKVDSEKLWADALSEYNSKDRNEGLWAKCFASSDGDENKTKAQYLKARVAQLEQRQISDAIPLPIKNETKATALNTNVSDNSRVSSTATLKRHSQKNISLLVLFGGIFAIILLTLALTYAPKSQTSVSNKNITSADNPQELMELIIQNQITPINISIKSAKGLSEISSYPWNTYRAQLQQTEVDVMENRNRWWTYKGMFYIRVYNPHNTPLMGFALSIRDGSCTDINKQPKKYMYFDMGSKPLKEYDTQVYVADLSSEYPSLYSTLSEKKVKHCGDVEGGWAAN
jgi:flagellar biogenesis protein FliO